MKFRTLIAMAATLAVLLPAIPSEAEDMGIYIAPRLSYSFTRFTSPAGKAHSSDHGLPDAKGKNWGMSFAAGYDFFTNYNIPARVEAEIMHMTKSDYDGTSKNLYGSNFYYSQETNATALFLNGYFDLHNDTIFTPYAGGGIGAAITRSEGNIGGWSTDRNDERNLAWNIGAGVSTELDYNTSIDLGYRYASFGTAKTGLNAGGKYLESKMGTHQLSVGLRYTF